MKNFVLYIVIIFTSPVIQSQHSHDIDKYRARADIQYTIRAEVATDSGFVSGSMELEIKNTQADMHEIRLYLPLNEYFHGSLLEQRYLQVLDSSIYFLADPSKYYSRLDSVSFRGVPIAESEISYEQAVLTVKLPQVIATGETGYFFISFQSKLPQKFDEEHDFQLYDNWFPQLLYFDSTGWADYPYFGWNEPLRPFADYAVSLTVDSSIDIAFAGELINEREHYGFHNINNDTIMYDILSDSLRLSLKKQYHIRQNDCRKFSFSLLRGFRQDRVVNDGLTVDVLFPDSGYALEDTVTDVISEVLSMAIPLFPYEQLTVLIIDTVLLETTSGPLIVIPSDFDNIDHVKGFLLVALTNLTIPPVYSAVDKTVSFWEKGLAYYICSEMAYELNGADGISQLLKMEKYLKKKSSLLKLYQNDRKLFNPFKKPVEIENELIRKDINNLHDFVVQSFREVPAKIASYNFFVGKSEVSSRIKKLLKLPKNRFLTEVDVRNSVFLGDTLLYGSMGTSGFNELQIVDFSLQNTRYRYHHDSTSITALIVQYSSVSYPVEIAYLSTEQDMILDTISVVELEEGEYFLDITLPGRINGVSLDPHYYLPDSNRFDNNHSYLPRKIRSAPPESYFIGYRKF